MYPSDHARQDSWLYEAGLPHQDAMGTIYIRSYSGVNWMLTKGMIEGRITTDYKVLLGAARQAGAQIPDLSEGVHPNLLFSWMQDTRKGNNDTHSTINEILRSYLNAAKIHTITSKIEVIASRVFGNLCEGELDFYELSKQMSGGVTQRVLEMPEEADYVMRAELERYEGLGGFDWAKKAPATFLRALEAVFATNKAGGLVKVLNQAHFNARIDSDVRNAILWGSYAASYGSTAAAICLLIGHIVEFELQNEVVAHHEDTPWLLQLIDESLRFGTPMPTIPAAVPEGVQPFEIEGITIRPGQLVYPTLSAANNDVTVFGDNPKTFRPERRNAHKNLSFSRGPHACLGAPLSRLELLATLRALIKFKVLPHLRLVAWERQVGLVDTPKTARFLYRS